MTSSHEMQETIARALCENSTRPCNEHSADAGIAVSALVLAGYLQTGGGAGASGGGSPPSAGAVNTAPSSPGQGARALRAIRECEAADPHPQSLPLDVMSHAFYHSEFGPSLAEYEFAGERADEGYRLAGIAFGALEAAGYSITKTDDGAGAPPAATSAAPLDPAAQAGEAIGSPTPPSPFPRRFRLYRHEDPSGVSGTKWVAEGIQFIDGYTALRWFGPHPCTVPWDNIERIIAVHGHGGLTEIVWLDGEQT